MNAEPSVPARARSERWWAAYLKTSLLVLPSIIFFAVAVIFFFPKIKQMCADAGYDARYLFQPVDAIVETWWLIIFGALLLCGALERWAPLWRRYRSGLLAVAVFIVHTAVLFGFTVSLLVMAAVGPALARNF